MSTSVTKSLREYPLFAGLNEDELASISICLTKRHFAKGAYLYYPGNPGLSMYLVESGLVRLFFANTRGEEFLLNLIRPGSTVGLPLLPDDHVRLTGAAAQQDSVVLILSREDMFKFMQSSSQFMQNIYLEMTSSMRRLTLYAQAHTMLDISARLASLLVYQSVNNQNISAGDIELPLSQAEIAGWVGASRGRVNRTLSKMQQQKLIRLDGSKIFVNDLPNLMKMAEGLLTYWV
jgi:CRP/FNR family transcriptional regulator